MMISRIGPAAVSAVSLTDSINVLVIQVFSALATGGTIICGQYIGHKEKAKSNEAACQLLMTITLISLLLAFLCLFSRRSLLSLVFGKVDAEVLENAIIYFLFSAVSFPFIALFQAGSAFYRADGNSRFPMLISVIANVMNIAGNALFIFVFDWGVAGAALATLLSRMFCAIILLFFLRIPRQTIVLTHYFMRPNFQLIWSILAIGIPSGIENGMFQFGKLAIQSSVSTLGTTAIAAQAITIVLESFSGIGGLAIGIGLMTVVSQCIGAGKKEEAKYYIVKLVAISEIVVTLTSFFIMAITGLITSLAGLEPESAKLCIDMVKFITVTKPFFWVLSFTTAYGMRAAGDVRFSMITSSLSMWLCRVAISVFLIRVMHFGPIAVWIGMASDWAIRSVAYTCRFLSGKWLQHKVIG